MVRVREMTEADIETVSEIRVRGWQSAYAGIVPQAYLDGMSVEEDARRRREWWARSRGQVLDLVAVDGRAGTVGWASLGPYRGATADPRSGEVYALYVRPELTGTGIGRTLLEAVHHHAMGRFGALLLWVLRDNVRGRRFYRSAGYAADGAEQSDTYGSDARGEVTLTELRYRRAMQE
ncbi:GNAT family N-acetyltransferase [Streptomyces chattanoogensis]|uniref:GNAT family N-acetyltransferase n=1 Tax=Streptomyces chattanoogensis TaxID=66876 RepID=UPI00369CB047